MTATATAETKQTKVEALVDYLADGQWRTRDDAIEQLGANGGPQFSQWLFRARHNGIIIESVVEDGVTWLRLVKKTRAKTASRSKAAAGKRRRSAAKQTSARRRQPRARKKAAGLGIPAPGVELKVTREGMHPDRSTPGYHIQLVHETTGAVVLGKLESQVRNLVNHTVIVLSHEMVDDRLHIEAMNDIDRPIVFSLPAPKLVPASRKARRLL